MKKDISEKGTLQQAMSKEKRLSNAYEPEVVLV